VKSDTKSSLGIVILATLTIWLGLSSVRAAVVTDAFVDAVGQIESTGGRFTIGDGGRAHGTWQMHAAAWKDVTASRARKSLPTWNYTHAHEPAVARVYARDYLTMLENQLRRGLKHEPTVELVYAAYNMGFTRLENLGFNLERTPRTTRAACARLAPLLAEMERSADKTRVRAQAD
jgi:hypothetical protein